MAWNSSWKIQHVTWTTNDYTLDNNAWRWKNTNAIVKQQRRRTLRIMNKLWQITQVDCCIRSTFITYWQRLCCSGYKRKLFTSTTKNVFFSCLWDFWFVTRLGAICENWIISDPISIMTFKRSFSTPSTVHKSRCHSASLLQLHPILGGKLIRSHPLTSLKLQGQIRMEKTNTLWDGFLESVKRTKYDKI